jgi:DNA-binding IscR family transcriptional regulator
MSRGALGGFSVAGDPAALSARDVILAIDGALPNRHCLFLEAVCASGRCAIKALCNEVGLKAAAVLKTTSVADLAACFKSKVEMESATS